MTNKKTNKQINKVDKLREITSLKPGSLEKEASMASSDKVYKNVTDRILEELREGAAPWVKPWVVTLPYNAVSQQSYSGINILLLWQSAQESSYEQSAWLTYKQAKELGGHIKKGEKATQIVYAATAKKKKKQEEDKEESYFFLKNYAVFNIEQAEGLPPRLYKNNKSRKQAKKGKSREVEAFLNKLPATVYFGGSRAYYHPTDDYVQLPIKASFNSYATYYATYLHELGHWTGHQTRLNRDLTGKFGTPSYAKEELIAEMTAAFLCAELGLKAELRHAGYMESWIKLLEDDAKAVVRAASKAGKAAEYLKVL